jgi:hypothetical protein
MPDGGQNWGQFGDLISRNPRGFPRCFCPSLGFRIHPTSEVGTNCSRILIQIGSRCMLHASHGHGRGRVTHQLLKTYDGDTWRYRSYCPGGISALGSWTDARRTGNPGEPTSTSACFLTSSRTPVVKERFKKPPPISRTDQLVLLLMRDKLPKASSCFVLDGDVHRLSVGREREARDLDNFPVVRLSLLDRVLPDAF